MSFDALVKTANAVRLDRLQSELWMRHVSAQGRTQDVRRMVKALEPRGGQRQASPTEVAKDQAEFNQRVRRPPNRRAL